ncbi:hypothetical protein [Nocardioides sp. LS1]|uniref:hypothetical protein n=1 Tax=Nocardioides sp. LS1 TaxID=1027620 RepID=UPI000F61BAF6|nr:hypothetical protein [Nocardioides sp. LS1]GCD90633.1 hypothetical protein NLS1_26390 [Nocardioides sp. LS1]
MYGQHSTLAATGTAGVGAGLAYGTPLGWLVLAVFVLAMALWALVTLLPRRSREVRKVNPAAASKLRLITRARRA